MRIYVKVKPNAGANEVVQDSAADFSVKLTALPEKGKANKLLVKLLAKHFKVTQSDIEIVAGKTSRIKIVDVNL